MSNQIERAQKLIEAGKKFGFKIYAESGEKIFISEKTRDEAKALKKKLDANDEVYMMTEDYIDGGSTCYREIKSI